MPLERSLGGRVNVCKIKKSGVRTPAKTSYRLTVVLTEIHYWTNCCINCFLLKKKILDITI